MLRGPAAGRRAYGADPELSIVIPVVERHGDLRQLFREYSAEVQRLGRKAEFIFVIDYRQREVVPLLRQLQREAEQKVILILLRGFFGESTALTVGLEQARGEVLVTLAAYFQVDPSGLGQALREVEKGADLVVGRRFPRRDPVVNRMQSWLFHLLVNTLTGASFGDISCSFRVMRRAVARELNIYGGMHRFIPVIALHRGFEVRERKLAQRDEDRVSRYFSPTLYLKRLLDVLTVFFILKFTRRPLRFFGLVGLFLGAVGLAITGYLGIYRLLQLGPIGDRPLLLLGVLLVVLGVQVLSIGLVGEIIIFTHAREIREYRIAEIMDASPAAHGYEILEGTAEVTLRGRHPEPL